MVQIRARNACSATKLHFIFCCNNFGGALCVESLHGGAIELLINEYIISKAMFNSIALDAYQICNADLRRSSMNKLNPQEAVLAFNFTPQYRI